MNYTLMSGAGNLFAVIDGFRAQVPDRLDEIARVVCGPVEQGGIVPRPDGLLIVRPPRTGGDCAMELYNADGSRPETCGNGLRCVAKLVADRGHVRKHRFVIETDAGPRPTDVELDVGRVVRARVHMGVPRVIARDERIIVPRSTAGPGLARSEPRSPRTERRRSQDELDSGLKLHVTLVDVGNPHCVLFVDDERSAPVATLGPHLERHARFPKGTNVEFLALRAEGNFLRVWERGVGETQACGSGACAAAVAATIHERATWPVALHLPGGTLDIDSDGRGGVYLCGPVEELRTSTWEPPAVQSRRER